MNEKELFTNILQKYDLTTVNIYKKLTKLEKENSNKSRVDVRKKIKDMIMEEVK